MNERISAEIFELLRINGEDQQEVWLPIKKTKDAYEVSNLGGVRSVDRFIAHKKYVNAFVKGVELKQSANHGYKTVNLCFDGKTIQARVHRLVLESFSPKEDMEKFVVNHKDGNKTNNSLENLEWCTVKENAIHAIQVLGKGVGKNHPMYGRKGEKHPLFGKKKELSVLAKSVVQLNLDGEIVKTYISQTEAAKNGYDQPCISNCCNGKQKSHAGFLWKFQQLGKYE